eukprot:4143376-Pleurochrysis_carterae.AAC.2
MWLLSTLARLTRHYTTELPTRRCDSRSTAFVLAHQRPCCTPRREHTGCPCSACEQRARSARAVRGVARAPRAHYACLATDHAGGRARRSPRAPVLVSHDTRLCLGRAPGGCASPRRSGRPHATGTERPTHASALHQLLKEAGCDHPAHKASRSTPTASAMPALDRNWPSTTAHW